MAAKTILIVDDEEKNIKLLKAILAPNGYNLVGAVNGEEAIRTAADIFPDLILLDIMMPGIDGFEVCRRLKKDERTAMIPIVMVTALSEKEHAVKAMEAGADDFLSKPVDHTELIVRVKSLLRIKAYHDKLRDSYHEIAEKNEKLRTLERKKEELTNMIIHDLRSPLMVISGALELLNADKKSFSDKQMSRIASCMRSCADINQLIQNLLDTHKMEEGKLLAEKEPVDMAALAEDVIAQFANQSETKHISLGCARPEHLPTIPADGALIKRVLSNLLNNAIRHTPEGGTIEVCLHLNSDGHTFHLSVKDNGNGLAPQYHKKIFDKFEQIALKQAGVKVGSSGLGLAFCKMAVEAHGGQIWVESEGEGKGATFIVALPC